MVYMNTKSEGAGVELLLKEDAVEKKSTPALL
jgi:hypothetical protein